LAEHWHEMTSQQEWLKCLSTNDEVDGEATIARPTFDTKVFSMFHVFLVEQL
jgi:hypothetical protein